MFESMVGKPAVDFELPDAKEEGFKSLNDFRDRWLILVFHRHLA